MRYRFLSIMMLAALTACQANETQQTAQPASEPAPAATQEKSSAAMSETAAQAMSDAKAQAEKAAAEAKAQAEKVAVEAKVRAERLAAEAKAQAEAAQTRARAAADSLAKSVSTANQAVPAKTTAPVVASGDAASGKALARKCAACHNFDAKSKIGPGLAGVFGREAGSMTGFSYKFTAFIKPGKAWHWDATHLAAWVCNSGEAIRSFTGDAAAKTKMPVQRICDPTKQADLIAYLKTL